MINPINKIKEDILIIRLRQGDAEAFRQIYQIFSERLYRFIFYRLINKESSEDILQETFLILWRYLKDKEKKITNLQALAYKIARNLVNEYYSKNNPGQVDLEEVAYKLSDDRIDLNYEVDLQIKIKDLIRKLSVLESAEDREIIQLRFIDGLSFKEIAEILDKSENNAKVILHRAVKKLKVLYKRNSR